MNIEIEIRSFVTKEKFEQLLEFFRQNAKLIKIDNQDSFYFDCEQDLRIQKNDHHSKIWLKKGKMHDDHREEIEIKFAPDEFGKLEQIFTEIGLNVEIKWFRQRNEFLRDNITVCLDYTKGYGYIIELEKMGSESDKILVFEMLKNKLISLGVEITPKEEFHKAFEHYKANWKKLI